MEGKRSELAVVKQKVRLQEWSAQVEAQQASGLNVREWCAENGIAPNTYYNHLLLRQLNNWLYFTRTYKYYAITQF